MAKNTTIMLLEGMIDLIDCENVSAEERWSKITSTVAISLAGLSATHDMTKQDLKVGLRKIREGR